jgi:hypothetical protein
VASTPPLEALQNSLPILTWDIPCIYSCNTQGPEIYSFVLTVCDRNQNQIPVSAPAVVRLFDDTPLIADSRPIQRLYVHNFCRVSAAFGQATAISRFCRAITFK